MKVAEKYTSASDMHFNCRKLLFSILPVLFILYFFYHSSYVMGEIKDSVVAYVDNIAITCSELKEKYDDMQKLSPDITKEEVINTMINRLLLVREAKKIGLEASSEDELIKTYIELKIRAFIRIKEDELKKFYETNIDNFYDKEFEEVRDEIESYLIEKELNNRLKKHIDEMREIACIKINYKGE